MAGVVLPGRVLTVADMSIPGGEGHGSQSNPDRDNGARSAHRSDIWHVTGVIVADSSNGDRGRPGLVSLAKIGE